LAQSVEIASKALFAQNSGPIRGSANRREVSQNIAPQTAPTLQNVAPKIASQWDQTNLSLSPSQTDLAVSKDAWNPASDPHPAIVRIIAFDKGGRTPVFGSGTYISSSGQYGIVITNWHVVRDSVGLVQVHFPNSFASYSAIISHDPVWDLTILMIFKPEGVPMVPIAKTAPKIDEPLWIAGYGSGNYRLVGGRCTQYVTPEIGLKNEFVEVSVEARQGDSGGPIFNQKGELAGVLFGSDNRSTAGSFCGRVKLFLDQSRERIQSAPPDPYKFFASVEPGSPRHKLEEGAELFRYQVAQSHHDSSNTGSPQYSYSDPRMGRGGAYTREIKTTNTPRQTSYPNFPDFSKQVPKQENIGQNNRTVPTENHYNTTVLGPAQRNLSPEIPGKIILSAESPKKESAAKTPQFSQPSERFAMAVSPPSQSPLVIAGAIEEIDGPMLADSALVAASHSGSFFTTLKIIAAIIGIFFVIFHLVKLMSIIEES